MNDELELELKEAHEHIETMRSVIKMQSEEKKRLHEKLITAWTRIRELESLSMYTWYADRDEVSVIATSEEEARTIIDRDYDDSDGFRDEVMGEELEVTPIKVGLFRME